MTKIILQIIVPSEYIVNDILCISYINHELQIIGVLQRLEPLRLQLDRLFAPKRNINHSTGKFRAVLSTSFPSVGKKGTQHVVIK